MLGKRLANPFLLPIVCADEDYEAAPGGIIGVEKVCHDTDEAQPSSKDEKLVFVAKLAEDVLLEAL
jgi:hypothetical protein